ncbi:MAG TPA: hypothetical protein VEX57_04125 [Microlunatus sp.]|nr:hypothetical protein [Microlunatus sp.]
MLSRALDRSPVSPLAAGLAWLLLLLTGCSEIAARSEVAESPTTTRNVPDETSRATPSPARPDRSQPSRTSKPPPR